MIRFVYPAHGREAELDAEAQVKFSNEKDSTSREITPETGQDLFDFDDKNKQQIEDFTKKKFNRGLSSEEENQNVN